MVIEAIIVSIALYWGLCSIGAAIDNVAIGIEQFSLNLASLFEEEEAE